MKTNVENRFIWLNNEIINVNDAKINVLSPTAQFGLNVFEGIRCYWNEDDKQLYAFRLKDHYNRLKRSQRLMQIDDKYSYDELENALIQVIKANDFTEDIAVRQTIFVDGFGSWNSTGPVNMFVSPIPKSNTSSEYNKTGLNCCISSWERISDSNLSPRIKCGANYINSRMAQREAVKNGYDTALLLNKDRKLAEGPGSCLFIIKDGVIITPLLTDSVLESITRDTVIKIARNILNIPVEVRSIDRTELYTCDEAFLCGSAMEITPLISVDKYLIEGKNEIIEKLRIEYNKCVRNLTVVDGWTTPIY